MANKTTKTEEKVNVPYDPYADKVIVNIPPPSEDEEGAGRYVSVNNYNAIIKYGEDVEVPRFVASMLENRKLAVADKRKNESKRDKRTSQM
jgi:hypothetical protein